jgi:cytochrome P450
MKPGSFDHHSEEFARDPAHHWQELRETCPVAHSDRYGGFYILSRYADVVAADGDAERFSTADDPFNTGVGGLGVTIPPSPVAFGFFELDPPEHLQRRRIYSTWFGPKAIAKRRPAVRSTTTRVLEQAIQRGDGDLVRDIIDPITGMNMCALVGLPVEQWKRFTDPFREAVIVDRAAPEFDEVTRKLEGLKAELRGLIEARRVQPEDDLISKAIQAKIEGVAVPDDVTVMDLFLIVSGAADTVAGLLSNAFMHLYRDRDLRARLIADPSRIPLALEELNRFYTPVTALARTVKTTCTLGGQRLKPGDRVLLAYGSANRDEDVFDQPNEVVIDRDPNRHLSFGLGPHHCIGARFARAESTIVVEEVLRLMPHYEILESEAKAYPTIGITNSYLSLPARYGSSGMPSGRAATGA